MSRRPKRKYVTRRRVLASAITMAAVGTAVALTVPAIAGTTDPPGAPGNLFDTDDPGVSPLIASAMSRDLTMTPDEVQTRLRKERWASRTEPQLRSSLGSSFAGAWFAPGTDQLMVGVTSDDAAQRVRKTGAEPELVSRTESELDQLKAKLDSNSGRAGRTVTGWYVDVTTNSVVVVAKPGAEETARSLAATSGVPEQAVRVVTSSDSPTPLYDVRGADAFYINGTGRCSIGFAVTGGFVTAGHCGTAGSTTAGSNRASQGTFKASSFPGNDYAYVTVNSNWTPTGVVNDYKGGTVAVAGSEEAPVGATVCRSGSTTGTHCGLVQAKNATVNYAEGTVTGLTRTSVCAEPGDSGGSWLSGNQAQGVTSGGSGNCTAGGTTFFQPVNEILTANNVKLITSGSTPVPPSASPSQSAASPTRPPAPSATKPSPSAAKPSVSRPSVTKPPTSPIKPSEAQPPMPSVTRSPMPSPTRSAKPPTSADPTAGPTSPAPPAASCNDLEAAASGTLAATGKVRTIPRNGYFRARSGHHIGCLTASEAANFDLYLQRWDGRRWQTVAEASSAGAGSVERLEYTGAAGFFRYRVASASGAGSFLLGADVP